MTQLGRNVIVDLLRFLIFHFLPQVDLEQLMNDASFIQSIPLLARALLREKDKVINKMKTELSELLEQRSQDCERTNLLNISLEEQVSYSTALSNRNCEHVYCFGMNKHPVRLSGTSQMFANWDYLWQFLCHSLGTYWLCTV